MRGIRNAPVYTGALGGYDGVTTLVTPRKRGDDVGYGLAKLHTGKQVAGSRTISETIAIIRLDTLVAALRLARLDFVKIDIEGHEAAFAEGAVATLDRFHPVLMMEFDDERLARAGGDPAMLWSRMEGLGYRSHEVRAGTLHKTERGSRTRPDVFWVPARTDQC